MKKTAIFQTSIGWNKIISETEISKVRKQKNNEKPQKHKTITGLDQKLQRAARLEIHENQFIA